MKRANAPRKTWNYFWAELLEADELLAKLKFRDKEKQMRASQVGTNEGEYKNDKCQRQR